MTLSDMKKVQSFVNILADDILSVRAAIDSMNSTASLFAQVNPSTAGTCVQGKKSEIASALAWLDTLVNTTSGSTWDLVIDCKVDSHRGEAL